MRTVLIIVCLACAAPAVAKEPSPSKADAAEMLKAMRLLDQSFGLESMPKPHCLKWGYGHLITADEVKACAKTALEGQSLPGLGTKYVLATLMADIGPQTVIAVSLDPAGWTVLSCDPTRPCPPRKPGPDKFGLRVTDQMNRACTKPTTIWFPEKKGCP
ncbi:MAG TPA: hypothetical protein VN947_01570 [Polyangia bacterium]|nr:hypothetical protein [Polyangia bacterium]